MKVPIFDLSKMGALRAPLLLMGCWLAVLLLLLFTDRTDRIMEEMGSRMDPTWIVEFGNFGVCPQSEDPISGGSVAGLLISSKFSCLPGGDHK